MGMDHIILNRRRRRSDWRIAEYSGDDYRFGRIYYRSFNDDIGCRGGGEMRKVEYLEYNVGDKVRFKKEFINAWEIITPGMYGRIEKIYDDIHFVGVYVGGRGVVNVKVDEISETLEVIKEVE